MRYGRRGSFGVFDPALPRKSSAANSVASCVAIGLSAKPDDLSCMETISAPSVRREDFTTRLSLSLGEGVGALEFGHG